MSDNTEALRLAISFENAYGPYDVSAELRRLHAENEALKSELAEQARLNGMGSEREARLLALNAELVEALRDAHNALEIFCTDGSAPGQMTIAAVIQACAALAKAEEGR